MKRSVLLAMGVVVTLQLASAQNPVPTYTDVDYVGDGDEKHFLDIYIPPGISEPAPTVVFIHGGGWRSGSKSTAMPHCRLLYEAGYVVVSIDYRLSQDSIFPAQIYDCKTAIRFLRTHAGEYLVDTCNIGVAGKSAGGHL
ncbi:MAG: alpha/beta hydrolase, partial [Lewinella sp.]|nr:alpha/beta hydrolase [Lewinella sp.]